MKVTYKILSLLIVFFVLIGCGGNKGPKFSGFDTVKEDESLLYVYRTSGIIGSDLYYFVYAGDKELGVLKSGTYLKTKLEAGKRYEIWGEGQAKGSITIAPKHGEIICIKSDVSIGFRAGRPKFEIVDMATCKNEISKTNYSYSLNINPK